MVKNKVQVRAPQRRILLVKDNTARIGIDDVRWRAAFHHEKGIARICLGCVFPENGLVHQNLQLRSLAVLSEKSDKMLVCPQADVPVIGRNLQPVLGPADGKLHVAATIGKPAVIHAATGSKEQGRQKHEQSHGNQTRKFIF